MEVIALLNSRKSSTVDFRITICVPTFSRVSDLQKCLTAIDLGCRDLNYPIEVLVSDNHSKDGTGEFLELFNFKSENIFFNFYQHHENIGSLKNIEFLCSKELW